MSRNYEEKEIDGSIWTVQQWPASFGVRIIARILRMIGGPVGSAIGAFKGEGSVLDAAADMATLGKAVGELAERLDDENVLKLIKDILSSTRCDSKEVLPQFDTLFMARYGTLGKVVLFAVEVNLAIPFHEFIASRSVADTGGEIKTIQAQA